MDRSELETLYRRMLVIRRSEERLQKLFADGEVPGFLHLSIGQEAVPTGVSHHLTDRDTVSSNHRGHGHTLAKGVDLTGFFAEIMGRATGLCKGRGGSMHVADLSKGMLGANGIVGAGIPITTGSALALKMQGGGHVAAVYFGDGALAEGVVHECFNIAALWSLPVLFVCENNGWSEFSPTERQLATRLDRLAAAFSITYRGVDGNRVEEVAETAGALIAGMRETPAPAILECATTRVRGHFEGDRQDYRDAAEIDGLDARDPLRLAADGLIAAGTAEAWFAGTLAEVDAEIEAAVAAARSAPDADPAGMLSDVYTVEA
ncbi:thiamine pyrophosphate-dependent dehydrogenase E1 component subunit alpha [Acuticoccus sediminis]|uniref:thiamine pyrophosphate-dependent dehydrogenase E1 component subunit alpha n=1 Tax=Acuticoccus sediminis TaxID=2184697 RepID=UPI001CFE3BE4|nr:thiamine pyrophosphate-dependent dehydrogenase E1 component subunit alpha [Acuticoccus sediminis]